MNSIHYTSSWKSSSKCWIGSYCIWFSFNLFNWSIAFGSCTWSKVSIL